jgi:hypothetical protein
MPLHLIVSTQRIFPEDWPSPENLHPSLLDAEQWKVWKLASIDAFENLRNRFVTNITEMDESGYPVPIDPNEIIGSSEELIIRLIAKIVRPRNFPLQEQA